MRLEERFNLSGLVDSEIVGDYVHLFAARLVDINMGEEGDERSGRVSHRGLAHDFTGLGIERRVKRKCSMQVVLEAMSISSSRNERHYRIESIHSQKRHLLIDTEYCGMLRRMQVHCDEVGRLFSQILARPSSCFHRADGI